MNELYCDGGVIGSNPSKKGGTWAFRALYDNPIAIENNGICDDRLTIENSGLVLPFSLGGTVSNNLSEMHALIMGLRSLPADWVGTVYSDSQVTLGRAFLGWKWNNIPPVVKEWFDSQRNRLTRWNEIQFVLVDGHPTRAELAAGTGKRGHPVSIHNVWCDRTCQEMAVIANRMF